MRAWAVWLILCSLGYLKTMTSFSGAAGHCCHASAASASPLRCSCSSPSVCITPPCCVVTFSQLCGGVFDCRHIHGRHGIVHHSLECLDCVKRDLLCPRHIRAECILPHQRYRTSPLRIIIDSPSQGLHLMAIFMLPTVCSTPAKRLSVTSDNHALRVCAYLQALGLRAS